jgi:hypothetical protein
MCYGLLTMAQWQIAFEMTEKNGIETPASWNSSRCAGLKRMWWFLHRNNNNLSITEPEACILSRLTSFNKHNVKTFFENLKTIMDPWPQLADGLRGFNSDETGATTLQKLKKVIAQKGVKQLNQCTSAERHNWSHSLRRSVLQEHSYFL